MNRNGVLLTAAVAIGVATVAALVAPDAEAPGHARFVSDWEIKETCADATVVCDAADTSAAKGAGQYRRVEVAAQGCAVVKIWADGGVEGMGVVTRPIKPKAHVEVVQGSCVSAASVKSARSKDGGVSYLSQACACRKATGSCQYSTDAGLVDAPMGRTLGPDYPPYGNWSGAGCQPKACVELAGSSSWPANCPR